MSTVVRQATVRDAHGIAEVHVRAWQVAYRGLLSDAELDALSVDERAERWQGWLAGPVGAGFTVVADELGAVVGFCSVTAPARDDDLGPEICEVAAIYVVPGRWRSGVGTALLEAALGRLGREGWSAAALWVLEDNPRARSFYARHGFRPDGAVRRDAPAEPAEVRLRRSLRNAS